MRAQRGLVHEVNAVCACKNVVIGEHCSTRQFQERREAAVAFEIPLQPERIEAHAERGICRLKDQKNRDSVERVLETSAYKSGEVRVGENPAVTKPCVERPGIFGSTWHRVPASGPDLDLVAALFRCSLRVNERCRDQQQHKDDKPVDSSLAALHGTSASTLLRASCV